MAQRIRKDLYMKVTFALMPKKMRRSQLDRSGKREFQAEGTNKASETHRDENKLSYWKR